MRRRLAIALVVLLAGCGAEREASQPAAPPLPHGDFGPVRPGSGTRARPEAPSLKRPPAAVARSLAAGAVGVVGVEGDVGVRPAALDVSDDGTLEDLRWTRWGDAGAEGSGRLRLLDCDPTCASGRVEVLQAKVRLSSPRLCGRATYFDRAVVTVRGAKPPTTYVRAPC